MRPFPSRVRAGTDGARMATQLAYLALGAGAGTLAGLFGVGGGLLIVPALAFAFAAQGMPAEHVMHLALGTSLATIVVTSASSARAHHRYGSLLWPVVGRLVPGIVVGALAGAALADRLPSLGLQRFFGVVELLVAIQLWVDWRPAPGARLPGFAGMLPAGGAIGLVSSLAGIGGGTLTVPFLTWCNLAMRNAVAVSAACGLPIALAGSVGYAAAGWGEAALPPWSTGYIYWPAFAGIAVGTVLFAPLGARLAQRWRDRIMKRAFALLLVAVGLRMLVG